MRLRSGVALAFVFIILVVLFISGMTLSYLMQGVQKQLEYSDTTIRCQYIGESALNLLLARLFEKPWEERWFVQTGSDAKTQVNYSGGNYDYFIQDTPTRNHYVDIWIKSVYKNSKRFFFWRVRFNTSLFSSLAFGVPVTSAELDEKQFPPQGTTQLDPFTAEIESLLAKRKVKQVAADSMAAQVSHTTQADEAISSLTGQVPAKIRTEPFSQSGSPIQLPSEIIPVNVPPQQAELLPIDPGHQGLFESWVSKQGLGDLALASKKQAFAAGMSNVKTEVDKKKALEAEKKMAESLKKMNEEYKKADEKSKEKEKYDREEKEKKEKYDREEKEKKEKYDREEKEKKEKYDREEKEKKDKQDRGE